MAQSLQARVRKAYAVGNLRLSIYVERMSPLEIRRLCLALSMSYSRALNSVAECSGRFRRDFAFLECARFAVSAAHLSILSLGMSRGGASEDPTFSAVFDPLTSLYLLRPRPDWGIASWGRSFRALVVVIGISIADIASARGSVTAFDMQF